MTSLIPRLDTLCFNGNKFGVPPEFVEAFVKIHVGWEGHDDGWRPAEKHWEQIVEKVLNTDAVAADAEGGIAIAQAVVASMTLLGPLAERGRCPLCPASMSPSSGVRAERERV